MEQITFGSLGLNVSRMGLGCMGLPEFYGKTDDTESIATIHGFQGDNFNRNLDLVRHIESLAKAKGATPAQVALSWVMAQGEDVVPIFGAKKRSRIGENWKAIEIRLTNSELDQIDRVLPKGTTAGTRYPEQHRSAVNL